MSAPSTLPLPTPARLRLMARTARTKLKPPFGLTQWDEAADDRAVLLERPASGAAPSLEEIASQLPLPATLAKGALLVVLGDAAQPEALLGRLFGGRVRIARHLRTSALLALGYARIGGEVDPATGVDLAWGYVAEGP